MKRYFTPPAFTAQKRARVLHVPGRQVAKSVLLKTSAGYVLAILPATHQINTDALGEALGETVSVANAEEVAAVFADCEWGAVPAFGTLYGLPTSWHARGELPTLTWPAESLPRREVGEIQRILQRASSVDGTALSPVLLGATQTLVDGGRVVFERHAPDTELVRDLWNLLPHSTRNRLWPASFSFAPAFDFDVVVVPNADDVRYAGYLTEEQAADYPQGRYELRLQIAAEAGDQQDVDALFTRRSRAEMFRFGIILLIGMMVLLGVSKVLQQVIR